MHKLGYTMTNLHLYVRQIFTNKINKKKCHHTIRSQHNYSKPKCVTFCLRYKPDFFFQTATDNTRNFQSVLFSPSQYALLKTIDENRKRKHRNWPTQHSRSHFFSRATRLPRKYITAACRDRLTARTPCAAFLEAHPPRSWLLHKANGARLVMQAIGEKLSLASASFAEIQRPVKGRATGHAPTREHRNFAEKYEGERNLILLFYDFQLGISTLNSKL